MQNVLLLSPSPAFVESLPGGKLPDRDDFYVYKGKDAERMDKWRQAVARSRILTEEFAEAVEGERIREAVLPL